MDTPSAKKTKEEALKPFPSQFLEMEDDEERSSDGGGVGRVRGGKGGGGGGKKKKPTMEAQAVYEVYAPIDAGATKDVTPQPIV